MGRADGLAVPLFVIVSWSGLIVATRSGEPSSTSRNGRRSFAADSPARRRQAGKSKTDD